MKQHPPKLANQFLSWFLKKELQEEVLGDLEEEFSALLENHSLFKAKLKYWFQVLNYLRPFAIKNFSSPQIYLPMIKHNFKVSYRTLLKNKTFSLINIGGLAIGITVSILIGLWVSDEYSFNKNHEEYDRIVQVLYKNYSPEGDFVNSSMTGGIGVELDEQYGHIFEYTAMTFFRSNEQILSINDIPFEEMGYFFQPDITHILSLDMYSGTRSALENPSNIIISKSFAKKVFDEEEAIGKTVNLNANVDLIVGGIFEDLPANSTFGDAEFFISQALIYNENNPYTWSNYNMKLFALLRPNVNIDNASLAIKDVLKPYRDAKDDPRELFLLPMKDWHLNSTFESGVQVVSARLQFIRLYIIIGIFILAIACINFMNLNTAQYQTKGKQVGVRKAIGSMRSEVAGQFLMESFLYAFGALFISLMLVFLLLPGFNALSDKSMVIEWLNPFFWLACIGFSLFISLIAGSYPALFLSSFNPIDAIKGKLKQGTRNVRLRQGLVVFQFTVSILLIIGTITVDRQINHAKSRPMGFDKSGLITFTGRNHEYFQKADLLKEELMRSSGVEEVAMANYPLSNTLGNNDDFRITQTNEVIPISFNTIYVSPEYGEATEWELITGRDFISDQRDESNNIIVSESAVEAMGFEDPIGKRISARYEINGKKEFTIIGVVRDMIKGSPFDKPMPLMLFPSEDAMSYMFIRLNSQIPYNSAISIVEETFKSILPDHPFYYEFVDDQYLAKFKSEEQAGTLATLFSGLAILISCLGLFGLSAFMVTQRVKEIGVRKVLGASLTNLWALLSKDFGMLIGVSCLLAIPIASYVMNTWLQDYEYRIQIEWWIYAIGAAACILITMLTVSYHSIKASLANPVDSLKME